MTTDALSNAITALGEGALTEESLTRHVFPLFSKVLERDEVYLANHSLGRPLDQAACDVAEAMSLWHTKIDAAWDDWSGRARGISFPYCTVDWCAAFAIAWCRRRQPGKDCGPYSTHLRARLAS